MAAGKPGRLTARELPLGTELEAAATACGNGWTQTLRASYPIPEPDHSLSSHWMLMRTSGQSEAGCRLSPAQVNLGLACFWAKLLPVPRDMKGVSIGEFRGTRAACLPVVHFLSLHSGSGLREQWLQRSLTQKKKKEAEPPPHPVPRGPGLRMGMVFGQACKGEANTL